MRSHGDCPQNCIIFDRFRRFPVCSALEFIIPLSAARLKSRKIRAINAREARGEKSRASKQETATRQSFDILSHPPFSACEHPLRCLFCDKKGNILGNMCEKGWKNRWTSFCRNERMFFLVFGGLMFPRLFALATRQCFAFEGAFLQRSCLCGVSFFPGDSPRDGCPLSSFVFLTAKASFFEDEDSGAWKKRRRQLIRTPDKSCAVCRVFTRNVCIFFLGMFAGFFPLQKRKNFD